LLEELYAAETSQGKTSDEIQPVPAANTNRKQQVRQPVPQQDELKMLADLANQINLAASGRQQLPAESRKNMLIWILAGVTSLLLLGGVLAYFLLNRNAAPVPDLPAASGTAESSPQAEEKPTGKSAGVVAGTSEIPASTPKSTPHKTTPTVAKVSTPPPVVAPDNQLLKNFSFEEPGATPIEASDWQHWGNMERSTSWIPTHGGTCMMAYLHRAVITGQPAGIKQEVQNLKPGQRYKFYIFVMSGKPNSGTSTAKKIQLRLEAEENGKTVVVQSADFYPLADIPQDPRWHEISVTGVSPGNSLTAVLELTPSPETPRGGVLKFDEAVLVPVP
jgi:hypothetical protein